MDWGGLTAGGRTGVHASHTTDGCTMGYVRQADVAERDADVSGGVGGR